MFIIYLFIHIFLYSPGTCRADGRVDKPQTSSGRQWSLQLTQCRGSVHKYCWSEYEEEKKTYVFILENDQACHVSDNGPQEKLFAFVDLKHTLWSKIALNGDFFIVIVIDVIWDDLDLCFCVHDTWISGSHIWGTKFVEPIKLPDFGYQL